MYIDPSTELVDVLNELDVPFLAGGSPGGQTHPVAPGALLARLAGCQEARLRLALIPLLLRHPSFGYYADAALAETPAFAVTGFKCYFAAAVLLQRKHWERLQIFVTSMAPLPVHFFKELALPYRGDPEASLKLLADRQAILSGRHINWLGTYEHAAQRFLTHMERRSTWNALEPEQFLTTFKQYAVRCKRLIILPTGMF